MERFCNFILMLLLSTQFSLKAEEKNQNLLRLKYTFTEQDIPKDNSKITELLISGGMQFHKGKLKFKPILSDKQIGMLVKLTKLKKLDVWYGSLSEKHKKIILEILPNCVIRENLNKL